MSTIIEKAKKGNRAAMTQLVDTNKARIYCLCQALMGNETEAINGTIHAFRQFWESVFAGKLCSEQAVTQFLIRRAVSHCKTRLLRKDSRAFHTPANKNFTAFTCDPSAIRPDAQPAQQLLMSLPPLHRTVYVLTGMLGLSGKETGELVGLSPDSVELALAAEEVCLGRILALRQEKLGESIIMDAGEFHSCLRTNAQSAHVPAAVDRALAAGIDAAALPLEKKTQRQRITLLSVIAACALVAILIFAVRGLSGSNVTFTSGSNSQNTAQTGDADSSDTGDRQTASVVFTTEMQEVTCYADIEIQGYGTITVALDGLSAPETVANFVELADSGFYDGLTFHRIKAGFVMQGGDPEGTGFGGSEKTITGEFTSNGVANPLTHTAGAISMARSSHPDSASSQFFIVHEDSTFLDGDYAVFGYVIAGMDIVDAVCTSAQPTDGNGTIPADEQPIIRSVTIRQADGPVIVTNSEVVDVTVDPTTGDAADSTVTGSWDVSSDPTSGEIWDLSQEPNTDETTGG